MKNLLPVLLLLCLLSSTPLHGAEFQYSVPVPVLAGRRAYLWIPPNCQRVRGLIFTINNMLEERFTADPLIRQTATDLGLGIVWVQPGSDHESPLTLDLRNGNAVATIDTLLKDLAAESGYAEIANAPLIVEEHSAASPFVWGIQGQMPARLIAAIPLKGFNLWGPGPGIPNFVVTSEWAEHGEGWKKPWQREWLVNTAKMRKDHDDALVGELTDLSSGHFDYTPQSSVPIAMFIRKAVKARLPDNAPTDGPVTLRPVDPKSGVLMDPLKLGTPEGVPIPYFRWVGDPKTALWYFDAELAKTVNDYMLEQLRKKPQMLDMVVDGKPAVLDKVGLVNFGPQWQADGVTFKVAATYLDHSPAPDLFGGGALGHASTPIKFRVGSGALAQVGPDTFRVAIHRGIVVNQGNPWEPWIIAYSDGDDEYRRTDRPFHAYVNIMGKDGAPQTIDFPKIPDQSVRALAALPLQASASSGLPVQYFMISGPAVIDGNTLKFETPPPRTRLPMRVLVGASQWGRATGQKVASAEPVTQEFFIRD